MNTFLSVVLMTALLVLWSPHGAGEQASSPVLTEHHGQLDVSGETSIYRNQTSDITIDEARELYRSGQFQQPADDDASHTNFGLTRDEIWLALEFSTARAIALHWFLEVGHPSLDEVHLYLFRDNELILHEQSGDRMPFSSKPFSHRNQVFPVSLSGDSHYQLFLSVRSEGTLTVPVTFWQRDNLWISDQRSADVFDAEPLLRCLAGAADL